MAAAEKELTRAAPELERLYRHFVDGKHPYARRIARLAQVDEKPYGDRWVIVSVPIRREPTDGIGLSPLGPLRMWLYTNDLPSEPLRDRLAADFACAQVFGGALAPAVHAEGDLVAAQEWLSATVDGPVDLYALLAQASTLRPEIAALARHSQPLPPRSRWVNDQRFGLIAAGVLDAFFARAPYPPSLLAMVAKLDGPHRANLVRWMALLLPDARGLDALAPLVKDDDRTRDWLVALGAL
jgi:hypothetical protein